MQAKLSPPRSRYRDGVISLMRPITPEVFRSARRAAQGGSPARMYAILEHILAQDDEIPGAMQSLVSAISQEAIQYQRQDDSDAAQRQQAFIEAVLDDLDLVAMVESLLYGHYYGVRALEMVWDTISYQGRSHVAPITYEEVPLSWVYADYETKDAPHNILYVGDRPYYQYEPGELLLYTGRKLPSYQSVDFTAMGKGLAACMFAIYAYFAWEDWAMHNEAVGVPPTVGTLLQGWSDQDRALLEQAVFDLSSDARAIISDRTRIDRLTTDSDGMVFDKHVDALSRARARIIKSESLTDNMNRHGSNAAMTTTNGIRLDVAQHLASKLTRLLNRRLVHPLLDLNFGQRLVRIHISVKATEDLNQQMRIFREAHTMGVPLSLAQVRRNFNLNAPVDAADTLAQGGFNPFAGA